MPTSLCEKFRQLRCLKEISLNVFANISFSISEPPVTKGAILSKSIWNNPRLAWKCKPGICTLTKDFFSWVDLFRMALHSIQWTIKCHATCSSKIHIFQQHNACCENKPVDNLKDRLFPTMTKQIFPGGPQTRHESSSLPPLRRLFVKSNI